MVVKATDDELAAHLAEAVLPPLLPALAYLGGNTELLRPDLRPDPAKAREEQGGLSPEQQGEIRSIALAELRRLRDVGVTGGATVTGSDLRAMMEFATGAEMSPDYLPLLEEELSVTGEDLRKPRWKAGEVSPDRTVRVLIVGAGMSGILAGYRLLQAGVEFTIVDKNDRVGGTWYENSYPGCRVDVANHAYSYSFAQRSDWPYHFSPRSELLSYFTDCAERFGVMPHIRLSTEVLTMQFDEETVSWSVTMRTPQGTHTEVADVVISAVGQLNKPKFPDIPGRADFAGPSFHSAQWRGDVDLRGRRVAIIGSAASAVQLAPIVAEQAAHVDIYQRTPNWFVPVPHYHDPVPRGFRWLLEHVPSYAQWYRFWLFWRGTEGLLPACMVDEGWDDTRLAVGARNLELRELLEMYLRFEYADRPDLLEKIIPQYPPASKRLILDNGSFARTLKRGNVTLVSAGAAEMRETGVVDADGVFRDADVVIYATGFQASHFLTPMTVVGAGGRNLHATWNGDARAYLGITVPDFPNFFMLYGPNTNIVVNGSIIYFSECEVNYVVDCIRQILSHPARCALSVRREVHDSFNASVDEANRRMVWGAATVNSWYRNEKGRVAQNWPFSLLEFWQRTRRVDAADYDVLTGVAR